MLTLSIVLPYYDGNIISGNSGDGINIAGVVAVKPVVAVYDFAKGSIELKTSTIHWVDFGANNEEILVAIYAANFQDVLLQSWNLASGTMTRSIALPKAFGNQVFMALSPGRHLLAVSSGKTVWVYRLADGSLIGAQPMPQLPGKSNQPPQLICDGLAFSADGSELAGLFLNIPPQRAVVAAWNVTTGKREVEHEVTKALLNGAIMDHKHLAYLPDGQAWVLGENHVIDRKTGATLMQLQPRNPISRAPLRVLPNDMILTVVDEKTPGKKSAVTLPFDRAAYEAAKAAAGR